MKFLLFSDQHLRSQSDRPKWRLDDHYKTQFEELEEVSTLAKIHKIDMVIGLGDFIHHPDISHTLVSDIMNWCKTLPCAFYTIVGNHCCYAYRTNDLKSSALGVLFESGAINRLDELIFEKEKVIIRGVHANLDPKIGNYMFDEKYDTYYKLIASHNFIIPHVVPFDAVLPSQVNTNANLIALGHYHQSFGVIEGKTQFVNPGSLSRWAINEQHQPQVLIIDTITGIISSVLLQSSLPANEIFDLTAAAELKSTEMNLQSFIESLEGTSFENVDLEQVLLAEGKNQQIGQAILDMALTKVQQAKEELK
jgi:DNA repair exonuclease SbcCD nuclease subunit